MACGEAFQNKSLQREQTILKRINNIVRLRIALSAIVLCAVPSCSEPVPISPFQIGLTLSDAPPFSCPNLACEDYGLSCGALLSVRIVSTEDEPPQVYGEKCIVLAPAQNICTVDTVFPEEIPFPEIPNKMVNIQVALWPTSVSESLECPNASFDLQGLPLNEDPQPALAGSVYFQVGSADKTSVPVACRNSFALNQCVPPTIRTPAKLFRDIQAVPSLDAPRLDLALGEPRLHSENGMEEEWVLSNEDTQDMLLINRDHPIPQWEVELRLNQNFEREICILVEDDKPQAVTAVHCTRLDTKLEDTVTLPSYFVDKALLQQILDGLALSSFPDRGLVIGRVVRGTDGVLNAAVTKLGEDGTFFYLNDNLEKDEALEKTSQRGFFVSLDAPHGSKWSAVGLPGEQADGYGGLIAGKLSLVLISLD